MNGLAERHRRIANVVEPLERMGVEATVEERSVADGELHLSLDLRIPPTLEPIDAGEEAIEHVEALEAKCERLREQRDDLQDELDRLEDELETVQARLHAGEDARGDGDEEQAPEHGESRNGRRDERDSSGRSERDARERDDPDVNGGELTDGERETLRALQEMGGPRASGEIAEAVDATLQSVQSWLPKLVQAGYIRTRPDPTDGRRKRYEAVDPDEDADDSEDATDGGVSETITGEDDSEDTTEEGNSGESGEKYDSERTTDEDDSVDATETVYIASAGGSPSQVFHVRKDCPQLQKSTDCVEKDRSVVPHHRPCGNCVPEGLEAGLVAIAKGSSTTTYHKREDCPKLGSANDVVLKQRATVPNHDPCDDCVHRVAEQSDDEHEAGAEEMEESGNADENPSTGANAQIATEEPGDDPNVGGEPPGGADEHESDEEDETETRDGRAPDGGDAAGAGDGPAVAEICVQNGLDREEIVEAVEAATAIYHVQRELTLPSDETETLLRGLDLFEDLHGGGRVPTDRARSAVRTHVPSKTRSEPEGTGTSN